MSALRRTLSLFITALLFLPALSLAQEMEVMAVTPLPAPDGNGIIASFITDPSDPEDPSTNSSGPILNDAGQVAFVAYLTDTEGGPGTPSDDSGIFLYDDGDVSRVAREGQASPDGNGVFGLFKPLFEPGLNNAGQVVFHHPLRNSDDGSFFSWGAFSAEVDGDDFSVMVRAGNPSPDGGEGIINFVNTPSLTDNGLMAVDVEVEFDIGGGATRRESLLLRGELGTDEVETIVREGDPVPDGDGSFRLLHGGSQINEAGQVVFGSTIGSNTLSDAGVFLSDPDGTLTEIVRIGDPASISGEVVTTLPIRSAINNAGQIVYATVSAPCLNCYPTGTSLVRYDDGERVTIAELGQPAPGGGVFVGFFRANVGQSVIVPAINEQGQVGFYGTVLKDGFYFTGFYRGDGTETIRVVDDDQLTPSGIDYFNFGCNAAPAFDCDDSFKMNERGQFAFFTSLRNTNPDVAQGIYFYDEVMGVMKVMRTGDAMLGSTITQLRFTLQGSNAQDNVRSGLNNNGQVAYVFELADGRSGLAVWSSPERPATASEPSAGVPDAFAVEAAYPNPFADTATLRFALPASDAVALAVYDVLGRRMLARDLGRFEAGAHRVDLGGEALAPGGYVARLTTESGSMTTVRLTKTE